MERRPDSNPGGEAFEDFVDAQLNVLRERLVAEYHRRTPSLCAFPGPSPLPRAPPHRGATPQEIPLGPVMFTASVDQELASRSRSGEIEIDDAGCELRSPTQAMSFPGATRHAVAESPDLPNQVEELSSESGLSDSFGCEPEDDCLPRGGGAGRPSSMSHGSQDSHFSQVCAPNGVTSLQLLSESSIPKKKSGIRKTGMLVNEPLRPHKTWQEFEADEVKSKINIFREHTRRRTVGQRNFMRRGRSRTQASLFQLNFGTGVVCTSTSQDTPDLITSSNSGTMRVVLSSKLKVPLQLRDPNSYFRVFWDLAGALFIIYDIISIPLGFFGLDVTDGLKIMMVFSLLFWLVDIPLNLLVGFYCGGGVEYNYWVIAKRYMKTWLVLDVFLVSFDTFLVLEESQESPTGVLRGLRTMRVMRSLRVMRMAKLPQLLDKLQENIQSEHVTAFLGISVLLGVIILINHVIACAWYGLTTASPYDNWVVRGEMTGASKLYLYVTSMHWSLTQFTPASMEIVPNNEMERTFNVVVIVFAMVVFSSFVSRITNTMSHLQSINLENTKQYIKLQNYFRRNAISVGLCIRVRRHLDIYIAEKRKHIKESEIPLLSRLSEPLRVELHYEMFAPAVRSHPFFRQYDRDFVTSMYKIAHQATSHATLAAGDILFNRGDVSSRMYIMTKSGGDMQYTLQKVDRAEPKTPTADEATAVEEPVIVEPGSWLSEATLWADAWYHHGEARALTVCSLVTICVDRFHVAIQESKVATEAPTHYAGIFIDHMNNISVSELTDLPISGFDIMLAVEVAWLDT